MTLAVTCPNCGYDGRCSRCAWAAGELQTAQEMLAHEVARVAELKGALLVAVEVLRTYDLTATADRCERALKEEGAK